MKALTQIIRLIVGLTFVFSGFVKLVDPVGTKIKMLEYFSEEVLNLTFLNHYVLEISIFLILVEFSLGIWLLLGYKKRFSLVSLIALILFFLFLTWYSAYFDKVTDCGCFGDAVKLSPWGTFYKNVVLTILIAWLWWKRRYIQPIFNKRWNTALAHGTTMLALLLMIYIIRHLPIIDFRPYAIGKNISEGMAMPEDAPQAEFKDIWYYKVNGKVQEFSTADEPWNIPNAEFVNRKTITLSEGYTPPIHDFSIENDTEGDITEQVLQSEDIYLFVVAHPQDLSQKAIDAANRKAKELKQAGKKVIGLFSQLDEDLQNRFVFPIYLTDETTLKTMIRSNPGLICLQKGTVIEKTAWREF